MSSVSCKNGGVTFGSEPLPTPEKNSSAMEHHQDTAVGPFVNWYTMKLQAVKKKDNGGVQVTFTEPLLTPG